MEKIIGYLDALHQDIMNEDSSKVAYRSLRGPEFADNAILTRSIAPNQVFRYESSLGSAVSLGAGVYAYGAWMRLLTLGPTFHERDFLLHLGNMELEVTSLSTSGVIYYFRWVAFRILDSGVSTGGSATSITDTSKAWTANQYDGKWMRIRPDTGDGLDHANVDNEEWRLITNTAATTLTTSRGDDQPSGDTHANFWRTPGSGVTYQILQAVPGPLFGILASDADGIKVRMAPFLLAYLDDVEQAWYTQLQMMATPDGATSDDNDVELYRKDAVVAETAR